MSDNSSYNTSTFTLYQEMDSHGLSPLSLITQTSFQATLTLLRQQICFMLLAHDLEREFVRHGLIERIPIETCGITVIRLHLDGEDMYVATLSMHWWRFVCQQLALPFPVVIESF